MIIALPKKYAVTSARMRRSGWAVRVVVAGMACVCMSSFAMAGDRDHDRDRERERDARPQPQVQRELPRAERAASRQSDPRSFDTRGIDARDARVDMRADSRSEAREDMRRQQQEQNARHAEASRRSLTAEEKADLRRQINEAGANLYPNAPRR